jgi:pyruvate/2-oxoglutarate dehydrogenase complex dihydrolipoamide acyltransferase (E2) component
MKTIIDPSNPKTDSFITLQHDIKDYSVEYVPKIIDMIKAKGYTFVTTEQCLGGKIPAYKDGKAAPAPAAAPAKAAPAPAAAPAKAAPAPAAAPAADPAYPTAAFAESPTPSSSPAASSADKITSAYGLKLVGGLIFGFLMY